MGFSTNRVTRALLATQNNAEMAMNWLFENAENAGISRFSSIDLDKPLETETSK